MQMYIINLGILVQLYTLEINLVIGIGADILDVKFILGLKGSIYFFMLKF